jgi:metallo-beta-lactamase class B
MLTAMAAKNDCGPNFATTLPARRHLRAIGLRKFHRAKHMTIIFSSAVLFLTLSVPAEPASAELSADLKPIKCFMCDGWNQPHAPFKVHGNSYYVGVAGLSAVLVTGPQGHILLDGALPQSAPIIQRNIEALGFKMTDVKWILVSHAHFDHAGGVAALQRISGAKVAASTLAASALQAGFPPANDPQFGYGESNRFAKVAAVAGMRNGASVSVGELSVRLHDTPGHTPGGASYSWQSCEAKKCLTVVYADSISSVSSPDFRFSNRAKLLGKFEGSFSAIAELDCDVMISTHPDASQFFERVEAYTSGKPGALLDSNSCKNYAQLAREKLALRLQSEARDTAKPKK